MVLLTCICVAPAGKGVIKGADFANSLVTAADIKVVETYLDKVGAWDQTQQGSSSEQLHSMSKTV